MNHSFHEFWLSLRSGTICMTIIAFIIFSLWLVCTEDWDLPTSLVIVQKLLRFILIVTVVVAVCFGCGEIIRHV